MKLTLILIILAYIPGLLLPIIHMLTSDPLTTWFFMIIWIIYVFVLLVINYAKEGR